MNEQALQRIEPEQAQAELPVIVPVEPKTSQQARIDEVTEALLPAYQKASELRLTDGENEALLCPFFDELVEIRPHDGLLYIPHIHISDRLIRVLGAGQWAMVRRREWIEGNRIYAEYVMKVRGCFVGESVGAMDYHPSNPRMNYSDALEGTRGECIRRIAAKDLGCGSQVWNPEYCRQWVAKYAEKVKGEWKRKGQGNGQNRLSDKPANVPQNVPHSQKPAVPEVATEEQRQRWIAELKLRGDWALGYCYDKGWLLPESGPDDDRTPGEPLEMLEARHVPTTRKQADAILAELDSLIPADQRPKPAGASRPPSTSGGKASGASQGKPEANTPPQGDSDDSVQYDEDGYPVETAFGLLETISEKQGRSAKGPWTRFGVKVSDTWYSTFSKTIGELAKMDKGSMVRVQFRRGDKGNDLVSIERAGNA